MSNNRMLDLLLAKSGKTIADVSPTSKLGTLFRRQGVEDSADLQRILKLPRRKWQEGITGTPEEMAELLTAALKRPGGTMTLRPAQAAALTELHDFGGLFGLLKVGAGKTAVSFLAPKVLDSKRPLLLIPAKLREKTHRDYRVLQVDWILPQIRVESYEMLARVQGKDILSGYLPDLIICDEAHRVKRPKSAPKKRVQRYLAEHPETKFVALSGTMTRNSLHEYWHILRWCLGEQNMPLPNNWETLLQWADCLDATGSGTRMAPGALEQLCDEQERADLSLGMEASLTAVRRAYQRRLVETPGVISTGDSQVACSLTISEIRVDLDHLADYFKQLREKWETPDGHPFIEAVDLWRHARELSVGCYYKWDPRPPENWLFARKTWCKFVRSELKNSRTWDTELQIVQAVTKCKSCGRWLAEHRAWEAKNSHTISVGGLPALPALMPAKGTHPACAKFKPELKQDFHDEETGEVFANVWDEWVKVRDTFKANVVAVWIDDTTLKVAAEWLKSHVGIAWTEHRAVGEKLAEMTGLVYYGEGGKGKKFTREGDKIISTEVGVIEDTISAPTPCIASIRANSEGRNLQHYSECLIISCPPNGAILEQLLGRFHRDGQTADEVKAELILACKEQLFGFYRAIKDARYIQETTGNSQKLIYADVTVTSADEAMNLDGPLWR